MTNKLASPDSAAAAHTSAHRLSPQQEQAWDAAGGAERGRVSLVARIEAPLSEDDLRDALARVIARHAILRTAFARPAGARRPLQHVPGPAQDGDASRVEMQVRAVTTGVRVRLAAGLLTADAESLRVILRETIETCLRAGAAAAEPPFQYLHLSEWHHNLFTDDEAADVAAWWRQQVDEVESAAARVGAATADPAHTSQVFFDCPPALAASVADAARAHDVATGDILLAAWAVTLGLFARSVEMPLALRVSGRFSSELENAVGPLGRHLPLLLPWSPGLRVSDLLARVRDARAEVEERQEYFHPAAIGRADPLLSGRLPAFACVERPGAFQAGDVLVTVEREDDPAPPCCPLALHAVAGSGGIRGQLTRHTSLANPDAHALLDAFLACLDWCVTHDATPIRHVRAVSGPMSGRLLAPAAALAPDPLGRQLVTDVIADAAGETPDAAAVIAGTRRLTYAELSARAAAVAAGLVAAGVGPESAVGVLMRGGAEAIVAMLAVLRAGGVYVPLDPGDPPARRAAMLSALNVRVVLATASDCALVAALPVTAVPIDLDTAPAAAPRLDVRRPSPDAGAYIIHTSGSTGEARPVLTSHRTLLASTLARRQVYAHPVTRFLLVSPLTFDSSIAGLFWTLADGGTLIFPQEHPLDAGELREIVRAHAVTHLLCIPRLLREIVDGAAPGALASLDTVIVAGEACPRTVAAAFAAAVPGGTLYNEYGVTEAGVWSTVHEVSADDRAPVVPIGEAIPGTPLYVCGDDLQLAPLGAVGELCLGGPSLARGYVGRAAATALRFVPDPYSEVAGARLYRTGDLVRMSEGRRLTYVGRADNQVKVRGQRVEPEQIEALLREALHVADVAVVLGGPEASPGLVVYYVERPEARVTAAQVRAALDAVLPRGVTPSHIAARDGFPRTGTGKLDRQALAAMPIVVTSRGYVAPRSALEETLASIWAPLLGVPRVGRDEDFFELGGDSIIGLQITSRARRRGIAVTPRQVLGCRTIAALAADIEAQPAETRAAAMTDGQLTPIQQWFFAERFAEPWHYNQALMFEAAGDLDVAALDAALRAIVESQPALQTAFVNEDGEWRAEHQTLPSGAPIVEVMDFAPASPVEEAGLIEAAVARAQASFDLGSAPLLRALVVRRTAPAPAVVALIAHHLVVDGVSWRIVLDDLAEAYAAARDGAPLRIPPPPASPGEWVADLARRTREPGVQAAARFWTEAEAARGDAELPVDFPGGTNTEADAATVSVVLGREQTERLQHLAGEIGEDVLLLAAAVRSLAEWSARDAVWVTLERHGRDAAAVDVSRTVGWFTTVFPLRISVVASAPESDLVPDVREQLGRVPADAWVYEYLRHNGTHDEAARLGALPRPPFSFNNLGRVRREAWAGLPFVPAGAGAGPLRSPRAQRPHLIDLTATTIDDRLSLVFTYSSALHARSTIERLGGRMLAVLDAISVAAAL